MRYAFKRPTYALPALVLALVSGCIHDDDDERHRGRTALSKTAFTVQCGATGCLAEFVAEVTLDKGEGSLGEGGLSVRLQFEPESSLFEDSDPDEGSSKAIQQRVRIKSTEPFLVAETVVVKLSYSVVFTPANDSTDEATRSFNNTYEVLIRCDADPVPDPPVVVDPAPVVECPASIVFSWHPSQEDGPSFSQGIYGVEDLDGGTPCRIDFSITATQENAALTRDGTKLANTELVDRDPDVNGIIFSDPGLIVRDRTDDTIQPDVFLLDGDYQDIEWDGGGHWLAATKKDGLGGPSTIAIWNPGSRTFTELTNNSGLHYEHPTWSPDEKLLTAGYQGRIAFTRIGVFSLTAELMTIDVEELPAGDIAIIGGPNVVVSSQAGIFHPAWSPDGQKIAFSWNTDDGNTSVRVVGLEAADLRALEAERAPIPPPFFPPISFTLEEHPVWLNDDMILFLSKEKVPMTNLKARLAVYDLHADGSIDRASREFLLLEKSPGTALTGSPGAPTAALLE